MIELPNPNENESYEQYLNRMIEQFKGQYHVRLIMKEAFEKYN
jgi:hypothetical protein